VHFTKEQCVRLGIISDIHGNALALEAVLADLKLQGVDAIVNLGDNLSGPLEARRTCDLLMARDFISVRGNHDRQAAKVPLDQMGASDRHAADELSPEHRAWLSALPAAAVFEKDVFLCHGTPQSDDTYWLEQVTGDGRTRLADLSAVERAAVGFDYPVLLCGHTHIPRAVRLRDGRLVINPGSVGCPAYDQDQPVPHVVETGSPLASYALIERRGNAWTATFRQVPYDHEAMAALAQRNRRPEWAQALRTGWLSAR
jgi:putative phosphoesterase